jgi:ATP-dependent protease ClpP protease subunit
MSDITETIDLFGSNSVECEDRRDSVVVDGENYKSDSVTTTGIIRLNNINQSVPVWSLFMGHLNRLDIANVEVIITSPGGSVNHGIELMQFMDRYICQTVVTSHAYSIAAVVFLRGDVRTIRKHSKLMLHQCSSGANGKLHYMRDRLNAVEELFTGVMDDVVFDNLYLTKEEITAYNNGKDVYFNYVDMVANGMATRYIGVGGPVTITPETRELAAKNHESHLDALRLTLALEGCIKTKRLIRLSITTDNLESMIDQLNIERSVNHEYYVLKKTSKEKTKEIN